MKIGIVTVYKGNNYGAFFQAFALKSYLEGEGHEVYFLEHKARNLIQMCAKKIVKKIINGDRSGYKFQFEKTKQFSLYSNKFNICSIHNALDMDLIILGSDEIWNVKRKQISKCPIFLGIGLHNKNMIAYAPSVNISNTSDFEKHPEYIDALRRLNFISVRDSHSKDVVDCLLGRNDIPIVVDPTLLHSKDFYCMKMKNAEITSHYILVYSYGTHLKKKTIEKIIAYAKKKELKLISILEYFDWCDFNEIPSPFKMLHYFYNADFIITDTFHGTIFSVIFNKDFVVASRSSKKIIEFLVELKLENRILSDEIKLNELFDQEIGYGEINSKIQEKREKSRQYLNESLKYILEKTEDEIQ